MKCSISFTAFVFVLLIGNLKAQEVSDISTDRPDLTKSPSIVPKGCFQLELGFDYESNYGIITYYYPQSLLRYGISENFELRLIANAQTINDGEGTGPLSGLDPI
jgi:hypothetical protein